MLNLIKVPDFKLVLINLPDVEIKLIKKNYVQSVHKSDILLIKINFRQILKV